jgi:hypothetical protein
VSARYFTKVSDELLERAVRLSLERAGLRFVGVVSRTEPGWALCLIDDVAAPEWMNGCEITPTVSRTVGRPDQWSPTEPERSWVSARHLDTPADRMTESHSRTGEYPYEVTLLAGTTAPIPGPRPKGDDDE